MYAGSLPVNEIVIIFAKGVSPSSSARSLVVNSVIHAPSLIPEELPAVTVPSLLNTGLNACKASIVKPGLKCSSFSNIYVFFLVFTSIGIISSLNLPDTVAFSALL